MTIQPYNYEYWRAERDDWKDLSLHWHSYVSRMDGHTYADDPARRDLSTELAPRVIGDWLRKPARTIRQVAKTPDEAIIWLMSQWEPIKAQVGQEAKAIPAETRFGTARYNLQCGNDVCWGFWLNASTHFHIAIVGTSSGTCH